jgi:hypothetical protein
MAGVAGEVLSGIWNSGSNAAIGVSSTALGLGIAAADSANRFAQTLTQQTIDDATLTQSKYDFNYRVFPNDISNEYHGKYMVININVPVYSNGVQRSKFNSDFYTTITNEYSKVDVLRFGSGPVTPGAATGGEFGNMQRFTRRITESIALYIPNQLQFIHENKFEEVSLASLMGKLLVGIASTAVGALRSSAAGGAVGSLATGAGRVLGTAASLAGYPINPKVQVVFSNINLRQFRFELLMAPRNQKESENLWNIIRVLRFHSVPEIDPLIAGWTYVPPAEFDITFYDKGKENLSMLRINTCVCNLVEVDYSPTGVYSTFSDGYPVAVRLGLSFTEVEPLHKARIAQGF